MGSLSLLQGIFWTQESNWGLLHCRQVLYQLSYHGRMLIFTLLEMKMPYLHIPDSPTISFLKIISEEKSGKCTDAQEHVGAHAQTQTDTRAHTPCPAFKECFPHSELAKPLKH